MQKMNIGGIWTFFTIYDPVTRPDSSVLEFDSILLELEQLESRLDSTEKFQAILRKLKLKTRSNLLFYQLVLFLRLELALKNALCSAATQLQPSTASANLRFYRHHSNL